jgi:hypothetical protein
MSEPRLPAVGDEMLVANLHGARLVRVWRVRDGVSSMTTYPKGHPDAPDTPREAPRAD